MHFPVISCGITANPTFCLMVFTMWPLSFLTVLPILAACALSLTPRAEFKFSLSWKRWGNITTEDVEFKVIYFQTTKVVNEVTIRLLFLVLFLWMLTWNRTTSISNSSEMPRRSLSIARRSSQNCRKICSCSICSRNGCIVGGRDSMNFCSSNSIFPPWNREEMNWS